MPRVARRAFFTTCVTAGAIAGLPERSAATQTRSAPPAAAGAPDPTPEQRMRAAMNGAMTTQMVYVAAAYGIPDLLASGPRPVEELAAAANVHGDTLYRLLRCLASLGIFVEEDGRRFRQNAASALLTTGTPGSVRAQMLVRGEEFYWRSFGALKDSVRTGQTGFDLAYGQNTFDWFRDHPREARVFDEGQAEITRSLGAAISKAYPFDRARRIVDIGGGTGTLLARILADHAGPTGTLFDLPHVVEAARPNLAALGNRARTEGGDFFKTVPGDHDLYLMKFILHDWEDAKALAILGNLKRAMAPDATLLVLEDLVCGPNVPCAAKLGDITMLARTGGRNMTEAEYRDLLRRGGFAVRRVIQAAGDHHILECRPA